MKNRFRKNNKKKTSTYETSSPLSLTHTHNSRIAKPPLPLSLPFTRCFLPSTSNPLPPLREGVRAGAPPGQEQREAEGLKDLGGGAHGDGVEAALLGEELVEVLEAREEGEG